LNRHQLLQPISNDAADSCASAVSLVPFRHMSRTTWIGAGRDAQILRPAAAQEVFGQAGNSAWWRVSPTTGPTLLLRLARGPDGDITCTGLAMGLEEDPPSRVTASAMRVPLQEIVAAIVGQMRFDFTKLRGGGVGFYGEERAWGFLVDTARPLEEPRARPGAKGYTDLELRRFAQEYRRAIKSNPRTPTKTLAQKESLSDQAIRYRRRLAEQRGFLKKRPKRSRKGGKR
jgi:hypothetical protein